MLKSNVFSVKNYNTAVLSMKTMYYDIDFIIPRDVNVNVSILLCKSVTENQ